MRFAVLNLGRAGLFLAISLYVASAEAKPPCVRTGSPYICITVDSTYQFRMPDVVYPDYRTPVVVILHDAGRSGATIINDQRLIEAFLDKGYALLAPDALPRRNLRVSNNRYKGGLVQGMMRGYPIAYSKKKIVMADIDGSIRYLKYKKDTGWYYYNIDQMAYSGRRPKTEYLGLDEIKLLRSILRDLEPDSIAWQ